MMSAWLFFNAIFSLYEELCKQSVLIVYIEPPPLSTKKKPSGAIKRYCEHKWFSLN